MRLEHDPVNIDRRAAEMLLSRAPPRHTAGLGDLASFVAKHLTYRRLDRFRSSIAMDQAQFADLMAVSLRTYQRALKKDAGAAPGMSQPVADRALRLARITALATQVLGSQENAKQWLALPQPGLNGRVPNSLLESEFGAREVEEALQRIFHGVYV